MNEPIIFSIDDDLQVLRALNRDLKAQYRKEYKILSTSSVQEALDSLLELKNKGETIALFIADQRMPEMDGVSFLVKATEFFPKLNGYCLPPIPILMPQLKPLTRYGWIIT